MVLKLFIKVLIKISVIPLQYFHPLSASTNKDHIVQVVQGNDVFKDKPSRVYRKGPACISRLVLYVDKCHWEFKLRRFDVTVGVALPKYLNKVGERNSACDQSQGSC